MQSGLGTVYLLLGDNGWYIWYIEKVNQASYLVSQRARIVEFSVKLKCNTFTFKSYLCLIHRALCHINDKGLVSTVPFSSGISKFADLLCCFLLKETCYTNQKFISYNPNHLQVK